MPQSSMAALTASAPRSAAVLSGNFPNELCPTPITTTSLIKASSFRPLHRLELITNDLVVIFPPKLFYYQFHLHAYGVRLVLRHDEGGEDPHPFREIDEPYGIGGPEVGRGHAPDRVRVKLTASAQTYLFHPFVKTVEAKLGFWKIDLSTRLAFIT